MIDIDKLHVLIESKTIKRRQGKTFLSITYLATAVSLQEPLIYCIVETWVDVQKIRDTINSVFKDYDLPKIEWVGRLHFKCNGSTVFFAFLNESNDFERALKGISEKALILFLFEGCILEDFLKNHMVHKEFHFLCEPYDWSKYSVLFHK